MKSPRFNFDDSPASLPDMSVDAVGAKWNLIIPFGTRYRQDLPGGKCDFNAELFGQMVGNFKLQAERYKGSDKFCLPVTLRHVDDLTPAEEALARGWIYDVRVGELGLEAFEKFDDETRGLIRGGKVKFQSPEFVFEWTDTMTGSTRGACLIASALVNNPFFNDMPRVAADANGAKAMPEPKSFKHAICDSLGLSAEASDESVHAELKKHMGASAKLKKMDDDAAVEAAANKDKKTAPADGGGDGAANKDGDDDMDTKKTAALQAEVVALREKNEAFKASADEANKRLAALEKKDRENEVKAFCAELMGKGIILASETAKVEALAADLGMEKTRKHYADMPPRVQMGAVGVDGAVDTSGTQGGDVAAAKVKFDAEVEKHQKSGLTYARALKVAKASMPAESKLLFSTRREAKA